MTNNNLPRRDFIGRSAAGLALAAMPKPGRAQASANDRIQIGIIGPGVFIGAIVPIIIFFSFQKYFEAGLLGGAVK